jgi:hypothetical protein
VLKIRAQDNETNKNAYAILGLFTYWAEKSNSFSEFILIKQN